MRLLLHPARKRIGPIVHLPESARGGSGVNLLGILGDEGADSKGFVVVRVGCGRGTFGTERRIWNRHSPAPENVFFHLKWRVWCILSGIFCPCLRQKNVEFFA